ncbi:hypothetical protein JHK84_046594 [Glycine max]|uniref:Uncharacterized protein n=1 Tax=Glycine soja TaxID=3848 RepID=A0A445G2G0_GLYSO|nr:hypothetical protein JHK84_046594 [Glycine max]RZB55429.1 hypothetical protein D0Y65_044989 [Glycine soja]
MYYSSKSRRSETNIHGYRVFCHVHVTKEYPMSMGGFKARLSWAIAQALAPPLGMALLGALWVLEMNEGASRRDFETTFASLLLSRPEDEVVVSVLHRGHVSTPQLWTSCWRGLHPFCLLVTRFLSFVIMLLFLLWDVLAYDASIFFYYTEWTIILVTIYFAVGGSSNDY